MLVKARKRMVGNPRGVDEMLPKVVSAEGEVGRVREHFWVVGLNTRIDLASLGMRGTV